MAKEPMHKKLYKDSPSMKRDEETGDMKPTKKVQEAEKTTMGTEGMETQEEGMPAAARHAMERNDMNSRHETEHAMHDHGKGGSKVDMHARHEKERKAMHTRHEKEMDVQPGEPEHKSKVEGGKDKEKEKKEVKE